MSNECTCVQDGHGVVSYQCTGCFIKEQRERMAIRRGATVPVDEGDTHSVAASDSGDPTADGHDNGSVDGSQANEYEPEGLASDGEVEGDGPPPFNSPAELEMRQIERAGTQRLPQADFDTEREVSMFYSGFRAAEAHRAHMGRASSKSRNRSASPQPRTSHVAVVVSDDDADVVRTRVIRRGDAIARGDGQDHKHSGATHGVEPPMGKEAPEPDAGLQDLAVGPEEGPSGRGRSYVFTLNLPLITTNDQAIEIGDLLEARLNNNKVAKFVFQLERGGRNERAHLQGWIYMANACTYKAVHKLFEGKDWQPWVKKARGTPEQCWDYCTKNSTRVHGPWSKGDKPDGQGKRNDIKEFAMAAKGLGDGTVTIKQLQEEHRTIEARYMKYWDRVIAREQPTRNFETECTLIYGPPATGKTHRIADIVTGMGYDLKQDVYYLPVREDSKGVQWWDGYEGQPIVVIEDAEPNFMSRGYFLRLIDKVPLQVQAKGGHKNFLARHVFVTSNYNSEGLFPFHDDAIGRRLHTIWKTDYERGYRYRLDTTVVSDCALHAVWTREK